MNAPSRLDRRLGLKAAVTIGLGAMIGAGVFSAFAPAARAAGNALVLGLMLAGMVAYANASSTADLAALYPESGGAYVYGRKRLGPYWGFLAGFSFVIGKLASAAAMALTFGSYAVPGSGYRRIIAPAAAIGLTLVNHFGVTKTLAVTKVLLALVLLALGVAAFAIWSGGATDSARLWPLDGASIFGVIQAAAFLFFAFAGYARIATLAEEVVDPRRTIPRAIPIALFVALLVYAFIAVTLLAGAGAPALAASDAPIATAMAGGTRAELLPVVRVGAGIASLGVLLSLLVGVSRTLFSMSGNGDAPASFAGVHPKHGIPHRAQLFVGIVVAILSAIADLRSVIGFSSFAVLVYYAIANRAALTLSTNDRRGSRLLSGFGLVGCIVLASALPWTSTAGGVALLALGSVVFAIRARKPKPDSLA